MHRADICDEYPTLKSLNAPGGVSSVAGFSIDHHLITVHREMALGITVSPCPTNRQPYGVYAPLFRRFTPSQEPKSLF